MTAAAIIPRRAARGARMRSRRGSILAIVLVTLLFTSFVLMAFIDKASTDLIVETRVVEARRLRQEAYSALEVALAVLDNFRRVNNGLRSPAEGWSDPLGFAGWMPSDDRRVEISFEDESGKMSLPNTNAADMVALFKSWEIPQTEAESLTDALMNWMKKDHMATSAFMPEYDRAAIPFSPPGRSLRSFEELKAIDIVKDIFYAEDGRPNELWQRFVDTFSLYSFQRPNINAVRPEVLASVAGLDLSQVQNLNEYVTGTGAYAVAGPRFFKNTAEALPVVGQADLNRFGAQISALRVRVTVIDRGAAYRLNAVVAPTQGGAQAVRPAPITPATGITGPGAPAGPQPRGNNAQSTTPAAARKLNYPFTVLEIRENDEPLPAVPPADESSPTA